MITCNILVQTELHQQEVTVVFAKGHFNDSNLRKTLVEIGFKPKTAKK